MKIELKIQQLVLEALKQFGVDLENSSSSLAVLVEKPADPTHGDYATNVALQLYKNTFTPEGEKRFSSPREFAQKIVSELELLNHSSDTDTTSLFDSISVAGPGFINFSLSESFLLAKMTHIAKNGVDVSDSQMTAKKVILEFTDPNPFKELHIGHMYSNTVGESLARMYEALGAEVKRVCYQGDVGMHVAKSVWGMQQLFVEQYPEESVTDSLQKMENKTLQEKVKFLGQSYAKGAQAYTSSDSAKKEMQDLNYLIFIAAQEAVSSQHESFEQVVNYKQFVSEDLLNSQLYDLVKHLYVAGRTWSLQYFDVMYKKMGMQFDDFYFESQVGEIGFGIVQKFLEKGIFKKSENAVIFPGSEYGLHDRVFINSLGLPTYEAKELGLAPEKNKRFEYDLSLIITGNEIDEYFKVLLKALSFTNPDLAEKTKHLSHGMVRLPEGKMSSRTGKILTAEWLLTEATNRIRKYMDSQRADYTDEFRAQAAEKIGIGAVKYAFLKQSVGKDISFNFDESLSFTGNSGPYIQYTYVRCVSVLEKAENEAFDKDAKSSIAEYIDILFNNKSYFDKTVSIDEKNILRNLYKYYDIVRSAVVTTSPHLVASHLYELSQLFNVLYANEKILVVEDGVVTSESQRKLVLVHAVSLVLEHGLSLLGITTVEQM